MSFVQGGARETWGGRCNESGERFLKLCAVNGFTIMNTWFEIPQVHLTTWNHPVTKQPETASPATPILCRPPAYGQPGRLKRCIVEAAEECLGQARKKQPDW